MKQNDICERAAAIFPSVVKNLSDAMYLREKLFDYSPDCTWPSEFHEFISTIHLKDNNMTLTWTKHYYTGPATERRWRQAYFMAVPPLCSTKTKLPRDVHVHGAPSLKKQ